VTIDCPATDLRHQIAWLELVRQILGQQRDAPNLFWQPGGRLMVSFGTVPAALFVYFTAAAPDSDDLWPLTTTSSAAIEASREAMSPAQQQLLDTPGTMLAAVAAGLATP
jgi:hypothetical protein